MIQGFRFGLGSKLVVIVVTGIVIGFTLIGASRLTMAKSRITGEISRAGQERVTLVAESVANLIIGYDYSNMESLAERIARQWRILETLAEQFPA